MQERKDAASLAQAVQVEVQLLRGQVSSVGAVSTCHLNVA